MTILLPARNEHEPCAAEMVARPFTVRRRGRVGRMMMACVGRMVIVVAVPIDNRQTGAIGLHVLVMGAATDEDMGHQNIGGDNRHDLPGKRHFPLSFR